jgi:hypothetical protein
MQLAQQGEHVLAEPALVGDGGPLLVDPAVDAPAEMLDEAAEDVAVQVTDGAAWVHRDAGHPSSRRASMGVGTA